MNRRSSSKLQSFVSDSPCEGFRSMEMRSAHGKIKGRTSRAAAWGANLYWILGGHWSKWQCGARTKNCHARLRHNWRNINWSRFRRGAQRPRLEIKRNTSRRRRAVCFKYFCDVHVQPLAAPPTGQMTVTFLARYGKLCLSVVWCKSCADAQMNDVNEAKLWFPCTNFETETIFWRLQLLGWGLDSLEFDSWWGNSVLFSRIVQTGSGTHLASFSVV
jgi:hypothetical protein